MTGPQAPPKIEFPCDYPIKVLGRASDEFEAAVHSVVEAHAPGFDRRRSRMQMSARGAFASCTITITATGQPQLRALHEALMATGLVRMVL